MIAMDVAQQVRLRIESFGSVQPAMISDGNLPAQLLHISTSQWRKPVLGDLSQRDIRGSDVMLRQLNLPLQH